MCYNCNNNNIKRLKMCKDCKTDLSPSDKSITSIIKHS
jgi:hypothetical protein